MAVRSLMASVSEVILMRLEVDAINMMIAKNVMKKITLEKTAIHRPHTRRLSIGMIDAKDVSEAGTNIDPRRTMPMSGYDSLNTKNRPIANGSIHVTPMIPRKTMQIQIVRGRGGEDPIGAYKFTRCFCLGANYNILALRSAH